MHRPSRASAPAFIASARVPAVDLCGARGGRDLPGAIGAGAVRDDHLARDERRPRGAIVGPGRPAPERRDDDGDPHPRHRRRRASSDSLLPEGATRTTTPMRMSITYVHTHSCGASTTSSVIAIDCTRPMNAPTRVHSPRAAGHQR